MIFLWSDVSETNTVAWLLRQYKRGFVASYVGMMFHIFCVHISMCVGMYVCVMLRGSQTQSLEVALVFTMEHFQVKRP